MSTVPRLPSAIEGQPAALNTLLAHEPAIAGTFFTLYGEFWSHGVLDHPTKETVRMRNARVTDCGFCRNVRFSVARDQGLTESDVELIDDGWADAPLPERSRVALAFADSYLAGAGPMSSDVRLALDAEFTPDEQVELGIGLALFHGFAKVLIALGCEPEEMSTTVLPTPGS